MVSHIAAAVIGAFLALAISPLLLLSMQRAAIHVRYLGVALHCMNCGDAFAGRQRIPLLARISGQSRCRTCSKPVSADTPWFEGVLVILLAAAGGALGLGLALPGYLVFVAAVFAISVVDLRHYLIPNRMLYPALFACLGLMILPGIGNPDAYGRALIGMAASWLFFFIVYIVNPKGMGFGDVRLSALIGFMTGWLAVENAFLAILLGLFLAAIIGIFLMAFRIRGRKDPIPYGPFLALGGILAIFGPVVLL